VHLVNVEKKSSLWRNKPIFNTQEIIKTEDSNPTSGQPWESFGRRGLQGSLCEKR